MTAVKGCGVAVAARILAALELGRRAWTTPQKSRPLISCPESVARLLADEMKGLRKEVFFVLYLNGRNKLLDKEIVSIGSLNASIVHPRELFRGAVIRSSAAVIVSHNHPAGDAEPSSEDIEVTTRLCKAGEILGIPLLDHVIVGRGHYASMKELGFLT